MLVVLVVIGWMHYQEKNFLSNRVAQIDSWVRLSTRQQGNHKRLADKFEESDPEIAENHVRLANYYQKDISNLMSLKYAYTGKPEELNSSLPMLLEKYYRHLMMGYQSGELDPSTISIRDLDLDSLASNIHFMQYITGAGIQYEHNPYELNTINALQTLLTGSILLSVSALTMFLLLDMLMGEMRSGAFKSLASYGVSRREIIIGKVLASIIVMVISILLAVAIISMISFLFGGFGSPDYPLASRANLHMLSLDSEKYDIIYISKLEWIGRSFLGVIFPSITLLGCALFLAICCNSSRTSIHTMGILILVTYMYNVLLTMESLIQLVFPLSYFYQELVIGAHSWSNYYLGIMINVVISIALLIWGVRIYERKDLVKAYE